MGQYGFRTASVNEDRIPIITKPSQVVYIHDRVWTDNLSDILLLKKVVRVRSASPTSTLINIDQEGEDTSNVCVLDEAGSDWSIDVSERINSHILYYTNMATHILFFLIRISANFTK